MALKCRKFEPNIFNKLKCQSCFGAKEHHSAEALENNKASRKVSKCGYLFVAPDYDFNNPLDKSRRWQRRFFRLYDDGELSYCVDEDPDTVPQQIVDMNKCTEVKDAEKLTSHTCSLAVVTPDRTTYIKANSKEEIMWWHDVLVVYPRSLQKPKNRRFTMPIFSSKDKIQVPPLDGGRLSSESTADGTATTGRFEVEKVKPKDQPFATYRGVRSMKHKGDKHYQDGLRKSSSLHDLSSEDVGLDLASSRYLSRSGDRLDKINGPSEQTTAILNDPKVINNPYFTLPRNTWQSLAANNRQSVSHPVLTQPLAPPGGVSKKAPEERSGITRPKNANERNRLHRERSSSLKDFQSQFSLPPDKSNRTSLSGLDRLTHRSDAADVNGERSNVSSVYSSKDNETDELKMAKSSELQAAGRSQSASALHSTNTVNQTTVGTRYEDLMYMKKGWLIKQGTTERDWKKHWFVLTGNSLRYYKDAKAEETSTLDGRIDLSTCYDIVEVSIGRNYGFRIKTRNGEYLLSAMTSGIRNNWMKAIRLVMDLQNSGVKSDSKSSSTDSSRQSSEELDSAATANRLGTANDGKQDSKKKDGLKNSRRHHSDINLAANVGQLLKVKEMGESLDGLDLESVQVPERATPTRELADAGDEPKLRMAVSEPVVDSLPLNRFVEGSENLTATTSSPSSADSARQKKSESKKEEEERKHRAKSPSARVKDKTRSKGHKMSSEDLRMAIPGSEKDDTKYASSDGDTCDQESSQAETSYHSMMDDNLTASSGDGMLVELLETEVDTLKEQLDHTHDEIVKLHETNMDLKTRLQTAVREKDVTQPQTGLESPLIRSMYNEQNQGPESTQVTTMRRQVKEARETIQKQKQDMETLQSKLAMSTSKLTGTEKALSEALKDLKQEKDKFMKLSNDWNKKIRNLENQMKEANTKLEKQKNALSAKENENKRLENDIKASQVKCIELEQVIKNFELEKRRLKDNLDDTNRKVSLLKDELKLKESKLHELEGQYETQIAELEQEFAQERDDVEQHMEDLKKQWIEAERKTTESDSLTNNMADIISDKDEIINQLEEKMIETDKKICDLTEDYQLKVKEIQSLQQSSKTLKEDKKKLEKKLEDLEKSKSKINTERSKIESATDSYKKQYEDARKENSKLMEELETERKSVSELIKEKAELEHSVNRLKLELQETQGRSNDSTSSDNSTVKEMIHNFIMIESEMQELTQAVEDVQTIFSDYLCDKEEEDHIKLLGVAQMVDDIHSHCNRLLEILKEGSNELGMESPRKDLSSPDIGDKFEEAMSQVKKLKAELKDSYTQYELMKNSEKELTTKLRDMETRYQGQIDTMSEKLDTLYDKCEKTVKQMPKPKQKSEKSRYSLELSEQIENQLSELEEKISVVEQVLPNISIPQSEDDEESDSETDEESDSFNSSEEDGSETEEEIEPGDILGKLKEMKSQLEQTNHRIHDLTCDLSDHTFSSANDSTADSDQQLKSTLQKCGEKINSLSGRFSDNVRLAKAGMSFGSMSSVYMFKNCVKDVKQKLKDIDKIVSEHEVLDAKGLKTIQDKIYKLFEYLIPFQRLNTSDFEIMGQVLQQKSMCQTALRDKETVAKRKHLGYEDKLHVYADRLSVEAIVLGQMASLIQQHHVTNLYRDQLMSEINSLNLVLYELKKKVDNISSSENVDAVSVYASVLAEKIILEGQLASCAVAEDHHFTDDTAILSSLNISDNPSILAMEVFLRSQVDTSVYRQLQRSGELLDNATAQVVTRFLLQGEITQALQKVKEKYNTDVKHEKIQDLVIRQRKFSTEELIERHETVSVNIDLLVRLVLLQIKQSSNKKQALESFINLLKRLFKKQSTELHALQTADNFEQNKNQQISSTLQADLDKLLSNIPKLFEEVGDEQQPESEESLESLSTQVADTILQKSVTKGWLTYICQLNQSGTVPVIVEVENQTVDAYSQALSQKLNDEATSKQTLSVELKSQDKESERLTNFVNALPDIGLFNPENMDTYSEHLVREAVFQSQLTYITFKMKLEHEKQMRDLKIKLESGQKVALSSEVSKDSEGDIQASMSVFEEILETKFEDECEVLSNLDKELKHLQTITSEHPELSKELSNFAAMFDHELSVAQERHDIHLDVLRQELTAICIRMESMAENNEREKESLIGEYEDRIKRMQDELISVKLDHEEELEQVRQDIMTAVCAIKANEDEEPDQLKQKILNHKHTVLVLLEDIQSSLSDVNHDLVQKLRGQIDELQAVFLTIEDTSDDTAAVLSPAAKDGDIHLHPDRRMSTSGISEPPGAQGALDISHHEHELELLKKEKDEALAEEVKVTKAALDAMRKAYEEDLEEEKQKYRNALKSMFTDDFVEEIRRRHEAEMSKLTEELKQLRLHYESKCEDHKVLESKADGTKAEYETHIKHLTTSNQQLNDLVNEEIGKLKDFIQNRTMASIKGNATIEEELYDAQIMIRVKDAELQKLRSQTKNLQNSLERSTEEQRNSMTQYLQLNKKYQECQKQLNEILEEKRQEESKSSRSLRRAPSFHHRARSPSPQPTTTSPSKKESEHHSRDSHRRRHIDSRDLKRSKSTPSIPYVFDGRPIGSLSKSKDTKKTTRSSKS